MAKFYTLSNAAGLIRSNKFLEKEDAMCVGTFRAQQLKLPVKIYEHPDAADEDKKCVLVCNPDGSMEKPKALGEAVNDLGNANAGAQNESQAHMLLASYENAPVTTFYLKKDIAESTVKSLEKALGVELGLYDPQVLHAYTLDAKKVRDLEEKIAEAAVPVERITYHRPEPVTAGMPRVGRRQARAAQLPEMRMRTSCRDGSKFTFAAHCELGGKGAKNNPKIIVYVDGAPVGEVLHDSDAKRLISEQAERAFSKFLKKTLG